MPGVEEGSGTSFRGLRTATRSPTATTASWASSKGKGSRPSRFCAGSSSVMYLRAWCRSILSPRLSMKTLPAGMSTIVPSPATSRKPSVRASRNTVGLCEAFGWDSTTENATLSWLRSGALSCGASCTIPEICRAGRFSQSYSGVWGSAVPT